MSNEAHQTVDGESAEDKDVHEQALESRLRELVQVHFATAHERVRGFHKRHLKSGKAVLGRHWAHRRDIPSDLISVPRAAAKGIAGLFRKGLSGRGQGSSPDERRLSRKEAALMVLMRDELLDLPTLQRSLLEALSEDNGTLASCRSLIEAYVGTTGDTNEPEASNAEGGRAELLERYLGGRIDGLSVPSEGTRDLLVFLLIGTLARSGGLQVTFGSSLAAGSAVASSLYLSSQSWWGALWLNFAGVPGWVTAAGAAGGAGIALLLTPALAPLSEVLVNRWRGERYLHATIDQLQDNILEHKRDGLDLAGRLAGLAQFAPDLLAVLRALR